GGGYVLYQAGQRVFTGSFCINRNVEAIDTEIITISQALSVCMQKALTKFATNILIHSDSRIAVGIVNGNYTLTSRTETKRIRDIQRDWGKRERLPHVKPGIIKAVWIPSHSGIMENEEADSLAKLGAHSASTAQSDKNPSHAAIVKIVTEKRKQLLDSWWQTQAPKSYQELGIQVGIPGKCPAELRW
ncbi:hypothetical protein EPUL_005460, partial [Erysiphe pulchra]